MEAKSSKDREQQEWLDHIMAKKLRLQDETSQMMQSNPGRATILASDVLALVEATSSAKSIGLQAVGRDDMVFLAQRMMSRRNILELEGKPNLTVTIGYHYTHKDNLKRIRAKGLVSQAERQARGIQTSKDHGAYFGQGVYMANNPFCFQKYGDVGLMCAIVQGNTHRVKHTGRIQANSKVQLNVDTILGNKRNGSFRNACYDEIVLQSSSQCLPLLRFSKDSISVADIDTPGNKLLWKLHEDLQRLMDKLFNNDTPTHPVRYLPWVLQSQQDRSLAGITNLVASKAAPSVKSSRKKPPVKTTAPAVTYSRNRPIWRQQLQSDQSLAGIVNLVASKAAPSLASCPKKPPVKKTTAPAAMPQQNGPSLAFKPDPSSQQSTSHGNANRYTVPSATTNSTQPTPLHLYVGLILLGLFSPHLFVFVCVLSLGWTYTCSFQLWKIKLSSIQKGEGVD